MFGQLHISYVLIDTFLEIGLVSECLKSLYAAYIEHIMRAKLQPLAAFQVMQAKNPLQGPYVDVPAEDCLLPETLQNWAALFMIFSDLKPGFLS